MAFLAGTSHTIWSSRLHVVNVTRLDILPNGICLSTEDVTEQLLFAKYSGKPARICGQQGPTDMNTSDGIESGALIEEPHESAVQMVVLRYLRLFADLGMTMLPLVDSPTSDQINVDGAGMAD